MRISTVWEALAVIQFPPPTADLDKPITQKSNATYTSKYSTKIQLRIDGQAISLKIESPLKYHGCMLRGKGLELSSTDRFLKDEKWTSMRREKSQKSTQILLHKHCIFLPNLPLTILVALSAIFGTSEALRHTQSKARKDEHRSRRSHLIVRCSKSSQHSVVLEGRRIILSGDKLYVDTGTEYNQPFGHPFTGYFFTYPESKYSGLISSICEDPLIMNWIYIDRDTYEVKFGARAYAEQNLTGPFDCTRQDRRLTFGGWEGFVAVQQEGGFWALYFDRDSDELRMEAQAGRPVIEIELLRQEVRSRRKIIPTSDVEENKDESSGEPQAPESNSM